MCGIVAYTGHQTARDVLIDGLKRLVRPEDVAALRGKTIAEVLPVSANRDEAEAEPKAEEAAEPEPEQAPEQVEEATE